jgi:glycosyltransferase involved in cell wall biosynthesis
MKARLSALIITKNSEETIRKTLESVKEFDEIIIVDSLSKDETIAIIQKFKNYSKSINWQAKISIYQNEFGNDIGKQRKYGLKYCSGDWILILDSDEIVSEKLVKEIKSVIRNPKLTKSAYEIPYQNYFLDQQVNHGGENYKMVRLFKKSALEIHSSILHNRLFVKEGKIGKLKRKIFHHSYRSYWQVFVKFTDYSFRMAKIKQSHREKSTFKKIFLYPIHMFWARYVEDKGYKDGFFRIPLDLGFAYMEFLTYMILFFYNLRYRFLEK